jgi:hypothetical protein
MGRFDRYCVERRSPNGSLDLKGEQPPTRYLNCSEGELFEIYFRENPDGPGITMGQLAEWMEGAKGWTFRRNTWSPPPCPHCRGGF